MRCRCCVKINSVLYAKTTAEGKGALVNDQLDLNGITRRSFLQYAGIGIGTVVLANPVAAIAEEVLSAQENAGSADITGTFKFGGSNKANFVFKESFFNGSSFNYSNQLGTFAACLALSSMGANDNINDYAKSADNVKDFMAQLKCVDVVYNDDYEKQTSRNSIGLICGHRSIKADNANYELVLMGIRGGNYFHEWAGNTTVGNSGDHEGFTSVATKALEFLSSYVLGNVHNTSNPLKILVSGFSRASAVTNMAGGLMVRNAHKSNLPLYDSAHADIKNIGYLLGAKDHEDMVQNGVSFPFPKHVVYQKDVYFYGFEVPSGVRNSASVDADIMASGAEAGLNRFGNIYSIVNPCDVVPMVAPSEWKFGRFGVDRILPRPNDDAYKTGRDAMLVRADAIDSSFRSKYPVDSFGRMDMRMDAFFNMMIDKVVHDLTGGQATYVRDYQNVFCDLIDYMQTGKIYKLTNITSKAEFKTWLWKNVINQVFSDVFVPGKLIIDIVVFVARLIKNSLIQHALDLIVDGLKKAGLSWGEEEEKLYKELRAICPMIQSFAKSNISLFIAMMRVFINDANTMEVHSSVLCLAWMQSLDSNYNSSAKTAGLMAAGESSESEILTKNSFYKVLLFDGNIKVSFAGEQEYMELFSGGRVVENDKFPYWYGLNDDFQMCVLLPLESDCMFKIESKPKEVFSITSLRYSYNSELPERILSYNAIGDNLSTMYATIKEGAISISATEDPNAAYNYAVDINNEHGDAETHCNIVLESANEDAGLVVGGGYNVYGTSSHLAAVSNEGYEFDYWTVDGEKCEISCSAQKTTDENGSEIEVVTYPFYVSEDYGDSVNVVAHFKEKNQAEILAASAEEQPTATPIPDTGDGTSALSVAAGAALAGAIAVAEISSEMSSN